MSKPLQLPARVVHDEEERLLALAQYGVFGTAPEPHFDEIAALAADICGSHSALISLVGADQLWFKSHYGYDAISAPRSGSFCTQALTHPDVMVVEDASTDSRFANSPLVNCEAPIRFYAGAPLIDQSGVALGVICAIDQAPKKLTTLQLRTLKVLANQVVAQMELAKALKDLQTLNNNKDKFFAIIAHDLRAAFHGILGFSEVLDTEFDELDSPAIRKIASYLNHSLQATFKLLENLLEWSMLENGSMRYQPKLIKLESVIDTVVTGLDLSAKQKNIQVDFKVDPTINVHADLHMLQSLLHNLMSNAIKFTATGGAIRLWQDTIDGVARVSITDTGVGMTPEQCDALFKPELSRSHKGTMGEVGTGLGLLLCKQFVTQHGGTIGVTSMLGEGSTFWFTLPIHNQSPL